MVLVRVFKLICSNVGGSLFLRLVLLFGNIIHGGVGGLVSGPSICGLERSFNRSKADNRASESYPFTISVYLFCVLTGLGG